MKQNELKRKEKKQELSFWTINKTSFFFILLIKHRQIELALVLCVHLKYFSFLLLNCTAGLLYFDTLPISGREPD